MDFKFDKTYPTEYSYVEDLCLAAREQIMDMYDTAQYLPDKEVKSAFDKPQNGEWKHGRRAHLLTALEDARHAYMRSISDWVSRQVEHEDPKIAAWVRRSASTDIHPHVFVKHIRSGERILKEQTIQPDVISSSGANRTEMSMSERFSRSLGSTKKEEFIAKSIALEPIRDTQQDKDRD